MWYIGKYEVFRLADDVVLDIYRITGKFPKSEMFGRVGQTRRAAASIPMNLAEGAARAGAKEFAQWWLSVTLRFVNVAVGSCEEVRYQLHLAEALGDLTKAEQQGLDRRYESVKKMLAKLYGAVSREP
jgi:four helix bundle protein